MATIYIDTQTGNWKLKRTIDGKDKRTTLRQATHAERTSWAEGDRNRPEDLAGLAGRLDPGARIEKPSTPSDTSPDHLLGFIDWFARDYAKRSRVGSITRMNGILAHLRRFIGGENRKLTAVDDVFLESYFDWRLTQVDARLKIHIKGYTAVSEMELLSGMFSAAVDRPNPVIVVNPLTRVLRRLRKSHPRPDPENETKYLDPEQLRAFLAALTRAVAEGKIPESYADLARVMVSTGLRVSATCSLEWTWITKDWSVRIPQVADKAKFGYSTIVADLGKKVLTRRRLASDGTQRVFPDTTPDMSYYYLRKVSRIYKLESNGAYNHCLRHSFGTALVDAGVPVQTIGSLLGQRNIKTTQRYAKVRETAKQEAVAKLRFPT